MPTSLALSLIPKHVRPSPGNSQFRAGIMESGPARRFGIKSIHNKPPKRATPSGLSFFLWKISLLLLKQLLRVFCVFSGIPRLGKRAGLIPY